MQTTKGVIFLLLVIFVFPPQALAADQRAPGAAPPPNPAETGERPRAGKGPSGPVGGAVSRPGCLLFTGHDLDCAHYYDQCTGASWKNCGGVWTQK